MLRLRQLAGVLVALVLLAAAAGMTITPAQDAKSSGDEPKTAPDKAALREQLKDKKAAVRLQAALELLKIREIEAVPVLINLLAEAQPEQRKQIEDALQELAGEWAPTINMAKDDDVSRNIRRDAWASWWKRTDGAELLQEFQKRTLSTAALNKIQSHIKKLGDGSSDVREQAVSSLVAYGSVAIPMLREAANNGAATQKAAAERCLKAIAESDRRALPAAAARLVGLRKPKGAVEVLLAYLPWTEDENLIAEVHAALAAVAVRDGKADKALRDALADALPLRRVAAGVALARAGLKETQPSVHKLFRDPEPSVRLRVALAAAAAKDKEAVVALIDALTDLPREFSERAHEALFQIAGEKGPDAILGDDADARKRCREAWATWWQNNKDSADLTKINTTESFLGYTLLIGQGRVMELGRDGKQRWRIDGLQYAIDAQVLPGNRVLIAEHHGARVTERDFKGNIIWQKQGLRGQPLSAQRLRNGNTFIALQNELIEVDRNGNELLRHNFQGNSINGAFKAPSGEVYCLLQPSGPVAKLDSKFKEIKRINLDFQPTGYGGFDLSPNGRQMVIRDFATRNAVVVDTEGKTLYRVNTPGLTSASWLPNGNVLIAHFEGFRVAELDRAGKVIWEHREQFSHFRARRR
jgi:HEAT repeat protein